MPLYEYECVDCHRHTEKIQKYSDTEITVCPHCGGRLERVISAPAISFKGGGWYSDLYSSAKPAASGGEESAKAPAAAEAGGRSGAASETSGTKESSAGAPSSASSAPAAAPASTAPTKAAAPASTPTKS